VAAITLDEQIVAAALKRNPRRVALPSDERLMKPFDIFKEKKPIGIVLEDIEYTMKIK